MVTGNVRFSYLNHVEPRANMSGDLKYSVSVLIDRDDKATLKEVKKAIAEARERGFANPKLGWPTKPSEQWEKKFKTPLRDGEEKEGDPAYEGVMFFNANNTQQPPLFDRNGKALLDASKLYSGCYGRVSVEFYPYNKSGSYGIACSLKGIQFVRDGQPLSATMATAADFSPVEEDETDLMA